MLCTVVLMQDGKEVAQKENVQFTTSTRNGYDCFVCQSKLVLNEVEFSQLVMYAGKAAIGSQYKMKSKGHHLRVVPTGILEPGKMKKAGQ